mmetsp:Transcript_35866/g.64054  ORF Transcript_35866/g.64054 Transcript_35866/m.64054 type:complete len:202 (-) Transcript_35866:149-754(-)
MRPSHCAINDHVKGLPRPLPPASFHSDPLKDWAIRRSWRQTQRRAFRGWVPPKQLQLKLKLLVGLHPLGLPEPTLGVTVAIGCRGGYNAHLTRLHLLRAQLPRPRRPAAFTAEKEVDGRAVPAVLFPRGSDDGLVAASTNIVDQHQVTGGGAVFPASNAYRSFQNGSGGEVRLFPLLRVVILVGVFHVWSQHRQAGRLVEA